MIVKPIALTMVATIVFGLTACNEDKPNNKKSAATASVTTPPSTTPLPPPATDTSLQFLFPKSVDVFGVKVRATKDTPDDKILHAANVMAQYLDNNEDGSVDNQMLEKKATLVMTKTQADMEAIGDKLPENDAFQDLYAEETHPNGRVEGVLHLITHVGYAGAYPAVFGETAGSVLADAMDIARGGRFEEIPSPYPAGAWYTYDDATCDYSCMATEYIYWSLTSMLGAQDFPGRLDEIQQEWKLNTRIKVSNQDKAIFALLTGAQYVMATRLPNGKYSAKIFKVEGGGDTGSKPGNSSGNMILSAAQAANDGYKIAFGDTLKIYMMNPDGTRVEELADGSPVSGYVSWGPDAKYVYFASAKGEEESAWEAFRVNVKTKKLTKITNFSQDVRSIGVSPDGDFVLFEIGDENRQAGITRVSNDEINTA